MFISGVAGSPPVDLPVSMKASALPMTIGQPSVRSLATVWAGCDPPWIASPRQTRRPIARPSRSARTASSARQFPWMSEMTATRMALLRGAGSGGGSTRLRGLRLAAQPAGEPLFHAAEPRLQFQRLLDLRRQVLAPVVGRLGDGGDDILDLALQRIARPDRHEQARALGPRLDMLLD